MFEQTELHGTQMGPTAAPNAKRTAQIAPEIANSRENQAFLVHKGTKPETPIDGVRQSWAVAAATGTPPSSSHASVAHTATRSSSQGPASALRFTYFMLAILAKTAILVILVSRFRTRVDTPKKTST